ncbi:MAG: DUF362 domain-containing protein [Nitrospirae bacterium]|nr:DUF362 domain-containing protein [Candidatus Manganitrophaceae bacterium]
MLSHSVQVISAKTYGEDLDRYLPDTLFLQIKPGDTVVLKPNWVSESHKYRLDDWEYVITHPAVITAVLRKVLARLGGEGKVIITDGPTTEASFAKLISHYPVADWKMLAHDAHVELEVFDLREHEWETRDGIVVKRMALPGDPRGKTEIDLVNELSEFRGHLKSKRGYCGADYDLSEVNRAHDGHHNLYSVSRSVLEADVFINLPKLKTHRKAGITCCLKNLVGINTYKNYLPHHSEGGPSEGGDQFPTDNVNARLEGPLMAFLKQYVLKNPMVARVLSPLNAVGRAVFGDTREVIRSGNWYGNDTLWRMVLDLNKVLFYGNPDGTLRQDLLINAKCYIGIVDAILAGEGHGPLAPEPVEMGYLICGTNPVAIDAVSASLMGFDPLKIPCIARAFQVDQYRLCDFNLEEIRVEVDGAAFLIHDLPQAYCISCEPQFGWKGHIEKIEYVTTAAN